MPFIAPWLKGPDVLGAMEAGGRLGLSAAQLRQQAAEAADANAMKGASIAASSSEASAANALSRDQMMMRANQAQAALQQEKQQQAAAMALKQAMLDQAQQKIEQTGQLGQERLDMTGKRNADLADYQSGLLKNRSDFLDWREKQPPKTSPSDFVEVDNADKTVKLHVPKENYAAYLDAMKKWKAGGQEKTQVPGKLWGTNTVLKSSLPDYSKGEPQVEDFLTSAASSLRAPGVSLLPTGQSPASPVEPTAGTVAADQLKPAASKPEPVPSKKDREVGKTYALPKGDFTWTEDGWTPAQ